MSKHALKSRSLLHSRENSYSKLFSFYDHSSQLQVHNLCVLSPPYLDKMSEPGKLRPHLTKKRQLFIKRVSTSNPARTIEKHLDSNKSSFLQIHSLQNVRNALIIIYRQVNSYKHPVISKQAGGNFKLKKCATSVGAQSRILAINVVQNQVISPVTFHSRLHSGEYKTVNALLHLKNQTNPTTEETEEDEKNHSVLVNVDKYIKKLKKRKHTERVNRIKQEIELIKEHNAKHFKKGIIRVTKPREREVDFTSM